MFLGPEIRLITGTLLGVISVYQETLPFRKRQISLLVTIEVLGTVAGLIYACEIFKVESPRPEFVQAHLTLSMRVEHQQYLPVFFQNAVHFSDIGVLETFAPVVVTRSTLVGTKLLV